MKATTLAGTITVVALLASTGFAQPPGPPDEFRRFPDLMMLAGGGPEIGVQVTEGKDGGVVIEEVRPGSPAEKAGLKRSDVVLEFDGERVRSVRQFGRLVQETPPGRTVKATVMREGQRRDMQITPQEGRALPSRRGLYDGDPLRDQQRELDRMRNRPGFNLPLELPERLQSRRLGVTVEEMSDQLAHYFGAKDGLLVTAVADGSAASKAGIKAGDVITSVDGRSVRTRDDLVRGLRDAREDEVKIGVVREKKESAVAAKIEAPPTRPRGGRL